MDKSEYDALNSWSLVEKDREERTRLLSLQLTREAEIIDMCRRVDGYGFKYGIFIEGNQTPFRRDSKLYPAILKVQLLKKKYPDREFVIELI